MKLIGTVENKFFQKFVFRTENCDGIRLAWNPNEYYIYSFELGENITNLEEVAQKLCEPSPSDLSAVYQELDEVFIKAGGLTCFDIYAEVTSLVQIITGKALVLMKCHHEFHP